MNSLRAALDPWRHLGALGFLCLWLLALSGFYLFAAIDTSVDGAYRSIDSLSRQQPYLGGSLRSLHRYAADVFLAVTILHALREMLLGRFRAFRRFSWLTGVPLLGFAFVAGVGGFWLNWDRLGQFAAVATAEWLDWLAIFAVPLTRNFLSASAVNDRLFSLLVFIHVGVPLLLIFGLWFHVQRINRAAVFPPRASGFGLCAALLALSLALPVASQGPADLARIAEALRLDWFYLFPYPLMYAASPAIVWLLAAGAALLLFALPFMPHARAVPVATVHPENCSGCSRCFNDCPYAAITMAPHPNGKPRKLVAAVDPRRCASCGICAGACPSSTPFRSAADLVTGIDLPQLPIGALRRSLQDKLAAWRSRPGIVVFGCEHGPRIDRLEGRDVVAFKLICAGMLPPAFVEYALREGAQGVMITGCRGAGCAFRLGSRWADARLNGRREPHLRAQAERRRVRIVWTDSGDETELERALAEFQRQLAPIADAETTGNPAHAPR